MAEKQNEKEAEIIVGTYEDYVVGYRVESIVAPKVKKLKINPKNEEPRFSFDQSFAVRCHSGSVRTLCANPNGNLIFSAGFDETINLFSLKRRKLLQTMEDAANCAVFADNSHLICGIENGDIHIYECKSSSMDLVKTLKGHKLAVTSMSVHPSGKVLLSISKDNTMRTWNLIKGRCAYVTNIRSQAHLVVWSKTGNEFVIVANNEIYLYNNSGFKEHNIKLEKRINSLEFISDNIFIVASDSAELELFDLKEGTSLHKYKAHDARVKCVNYLDESQIAIRYITASSDGMLKLWSIDKSSKEGQTPRELAQVDTGARLTSMVSTTFKHR